VPKTRDTAREYRRLEERITLQAWLVTTLRFAGRDASEERRCLRELEARRALLATARAQQPGSGPPRRRPGPPPAGRRVAAPGAVRLH